MAKKRILLIIIALFMISLPLAAAQEEKSISFTFTFYSNGSVEASNVWVRYESPDLRNAVESSDYKIVLNFKDKSAIEQYYDVVFLMAAETAQGPETLQSPYIFLNAEFAYKDNPDKIEIYHKGSLAYQKSLENLCNNDKVCNNNETSISCPSDCSKSIKDGWCDAIPDGICDPDCEKNADIDCSARKEIPPYTSKFLISIILIIVILGIIGFYGYNKKKG